MATSYIKTEKKGRVRVTADGVKTYSQLLNELFSLVDTSKVTKDTNLVFNGNTFYTLTYLAPTMAAFSRIGTSNQKASMDFMILQESGSTYERIVGAEYINNSSNIVSSGTVADIVY